MAHNLKKTETQKDILMTVNPKTYSGTVELLNASGLVPVPHNKPWSSMPLRPQQDTDGMLFLLLFGVQLLVSSSVYPIPILLHVCIYDLGLVVNETGATLMHDWVQLIKRIASYWIEVCCRSSDQPSHINFYPQFPLTGKQTNNRTWFNTFAESSHTSGQEEYICLLSISSDGRECLGVADQITKSAEDFQRANHWRTFTGDRE